MPTPQKKQPLFFPFLFASFGEQVLAQLARDESCEPVFGTEIAEKISKKKEDFSTHEEFMAEAVTPVMEAFLGKACPSAINRKPIVQWVINQYLSHRHNGKPVLAEDLYKIDDNLKYFDSLKNSPVFKQSGASPDLLQYKTYAAFEQMLDPHLKRKAQKEMLAEMFNMTPEQKAQIMAETTVLYDGPEGRVVVPHTPEASKYWGSNTKWCISGRDNNSAEQMFPYYNKISPVIMILPKGQTDNKIALVSQVLYNSEDKSISTLPEPHNGLMRLCLESLSTGTQKNIAFWMPKKLFSDVTTVQHSYPATNTLSLLAQSLHEEIKKIKSDGKEPDQNLWSRHDFSLAALKLDPLMMYVGDYIPSELLRHNREFLLSVLEQHPSVFRVSGIFRHISPELKQDREFMLAAVQKHGCALEYASPELKNDREIVMAAVQKDGSTVKYAGPNVEGDRDILMAAVRQDADVLMHNEELQNDREFVLAAVQQDSGILIFAADYLMDDSEIILTAIEKDFSKFTYAGPKLKSDESFMRYLLRAYEDIPFAIRADNESWQPADEVLAHYQLMALEKIAARDDTEKFIQYARHFKSTWGNPDILLAADPAVTLEKIRAEMTSTLPAPRRANGPHP